MIPPLTRSRRVALRRRTPSPVLALGLAALLGLFVGGIATLPAAAQTTQIKGVLSAFDINNDSGQIAYGFEIQFEGADESDLALPGYGEGYGRPTFVPYPTGVRVRWESSYDSTHNSYGHKTQPRDPNVPTFSWNDCYLFGSGYATAGCEHFSQGVKPSFLAKNVTITARWLVEKPGEPGVLIPAPTTVGIPFPSYAVTPPGQPPVVAVKIDPPELYGDAQWIKVYVAELKTPLTEDQLTSDNPLVPIDPANIEIDWDLLQPEPLSGCNGNCGNGVGGGSQIGPDIRAIVRRVETYKFTGSYDALTHQAICGDGSCTAPSAGELGIVEGAQNSAVNIESDSVLVKVNGSGGVSGSGGDIACGNACAAFADANSVVTLTAEPNGRAFWPGWNGPCTGLDLECEFVAQPGGNEVQASFSEVFKLRARSQGNGRVQTATVADGILATAPIDCAQTSGVCQADVSDGAFVTLTATADEGHHFTGWSGNCSGQTTTCNVTMTSAADVRASFAVPEPGLAAGLMGGMLMLARVVRRRSGR